MKALMSPMAAINALFVVAALFLPQAKDLFSPELEIAIIASVNGIVAIVERLKGK